MKIDNQIVGTYTYVNPTQSLRELSLGVRSSGGFPLDGILDEVSFINGQTTVGQDSDLYNNGNGTTI